MGGLIDMSHEIYCYYEVLALLDGFLDGFGVASKSRVGVVVAEPLPAVLADHDVAAWAALPGGVALLLDVLVPHVAAVLGAAPVLIADSTADTGVSEGSSWPA